MNGRKPSIACPHHSAGAADRVGVNRIAYATLILVGFIPFGITTITSTLRKEQSDGNSIIHRYENQHWL